MQETSKPTVAEKPASKPGNSKKILLILGLVLVGCLCVVCLAVIAFFVFSKPSVSTTEYLQKTEVNFQTVGPLVTAVQDSIESDLGGNEPDQKFADYSARITAAAATAKALDDKVAEVQATIPATNSDTEKLDTVLKDYYVSAKELGSSYKALAQTYVDALPVMSDLNDAVEAFQAIAAGTPPTTAADFTALAVSFRQQSSDLKADLPKLDKISTPTETAFAITQLSKQLTLYTEFLDATAHAYDQLAIVITTQDEALAASVTEETQTAQTEFSTGMTEATDITKASKEALVTTYLAKVDKVLEKQTAVEEEFTRVKALAD